MTPNSAERVTKPQGGKVIARNTLINLFGLSLPLLAAVYSIPQILAGLGPEKFGLLVLAWAMVGYMSVLDLGLGQSLTRSLAPAFADGDNHRVAQLTRSALAIFAVLGAVAGLGVLALNPWILKFAHVSPALVADAGDAFALLAFIVPAVILCAALTGILEAGHRFALSNMVSMPVGVFNFLAPLLALHFTNSLLGVFLVLAIVRALALLALVFMVWRHTSAFGAARANWRDASALARFGGWVTVSRIIVPITGNLDRFVIAALVSLKALAIYAPPLEIATRLLIIPGAITRVLLPAIAAQPGVERGYIIPLFERGMMFVLIAVFPCSFTAILFAKEGLSLWLGPEIAPAAAPVLQFMMLAVFINSMGYLPAVMLLAVGKPDYSAKIQLATLPVYFLALWLIVPIYGAVGAAATWTIRVAIDTVAHFWLADRAVQGYSARTQRLILLSVGGCAILAAAMFVGGGQVFVWIGGLAAAASLGWLFALDVKEKDWLRGLARTR